ncbi:hypothetical protein G7D34_003695 [Salmonella enterica]|nr:hypothetical protein [Salmonella enterica]
MQNINTYKDLKDAAMLFLNRNDQATRDMMPNFVNFAEKQFTRLIKLPYYETIANFTFDDNFNYVVIPQDFVSLVSLAINNKSYKRVDLETFYRLAEKENNKERVFTRKGEQIHFLPLPLPGDKVEMVYYQDIPEMTFDDDQPYSLLIAPDILLYLVLRHASIWLRDNEQEQYWNDKAQVAAQALTVVLDEAEWSGSTLKVYNLGKDK